MPGRTSDLLHTGHETITQFRPYLINKVRLQSSTCPPSGARDATRRCRRKPGRLRPDALRSGARNSAGERPTRNGVQPKTERSRCGSRLSTSPSSASWNASGSRQNSRIQPHRGRSDCAEVATRMPNRTGSLRRGSRLRALDRRRARADAASGPAIAVVAQASPAHRWIGPGPS